MIKLLKMADSGIAPRRNWFLRTGDLLGHAVRSTAYRAGLGNDEWYKNYMQQRTDRAVSDEVARIAGIRSKAGKPLTESDAKAMAKNLANAYRNLSLYGGGNRRGDVYENHATKAQGLVSTSIVGQVLNAAQPKYDAIVNTQEGQQPVSAINENRFNPNAINGVATGLDVGGYFLPYVGQSLLYRTILQHAIDAEYKFGKGDSLGAGKEVGLGALDLLGSGLLRGAGNISRLGKLKRAVKLQPRVTLQAFSRDIPAKVHLTNNGLLNRIRNASPRDIMKEFKNGSFKNISRDGRLPAEAWKADIDSLKAFRKTLERGLKRHPAAKQTILSNIEKIDKSIAARERILRSMPSLPVDPNSSILNQLVWDPVKRTFTNASNILFAGWGAQGAYDSAKEIRRGNYGRGALGMALSVPAALPGVSPVARAISGSKGLLGTIGSKAFSIADKPVYWGQTSKASTLPGRLSRYIARHPYYTEFFGNTAMNMAMPAAREPGTAAVEYNAASAVPQTPEPMSQTTAASRTGNKGHSYMIPILLGSLGVGGLLALLDWLYSRRKSSDENPEEHDED